MKFISHTHLKEGVWIVVEPVRQRGKNDGSINGQRYSQLLAMVCDVHTSGKDVTFEQDGGGGE